LEEVVMVKPSKWRLSGLLGLAAMVCLTAVGFQPGSAQENFGTIIGTVIAEDTGNPLSGANVFLVGTGMGTLTNQNGNFIIENVPPGEYQLEVSSMSYSSATQEIVVVAGERTTVNAELVLDPLSLDEIVVTGYGTSRKEELTGSMVSIPAADLSVVPATTFQDVIQGNPGIQVSARDGAPGAGISIRVRGIGSITAGSEPLYVIDGVPLYNDANNIGVTDFDNAGRSANTLASLNPKDIENITVLKDAASTAIYGSRGANGVVLITTKGGVSGSPIWTSAPQLEFSAKFGLSNFAYDNLHKGLTGEQYHDYYISARMAAGMSQADAEQQFLAHWPMGIQNNVWRDIITRTGQTAQYDLSATGGSERYTYYLSASVWDQMGIVKANYFDRYSTRANLTAQLTDKISLANNLTYSWTDQGGITDGSRWAAPFYQVVFSPPVIPIYDEQGEFYAKHTHTMGANHPLGHLVEDERTRETSRLIENLTGTYQATDDITLQSAWSFDVYNVDDFEYQNPRYGDGRNDGGAFEDGRSNNLSWQGTQTATFAKLFDNVHNVDAVVGYEAIKSRRDRVNLYGEGFAHRNLKRGSNAAITDGWSDRSTYTFQSYFSRLNYDYDQTYFASASFRRDGSSRFGPEKRYGNFWSLGLGWTLTNTEFMDFLEVFDYLKLRTSYGEVGNADIGNFEWQGLYNFTPDYYGLPGSRPGQVENSRLTWESQDAFNVGFDYAVLDNRVTGTLEYFKKVSSDLLLNVPVSPTTGFTSFLQNFGDMENSGIEFSVHSELIRAPDYNLDLDFNITKQSNKVTRLESPFIAGTKRREEERDYQSYYLYGWAGVDPDNGKPLYYTDASKTTVTSDVSEIERFYDGKSATPEYLGSLGLSGRYGRFTLSATATYMFGHYLFEAAARHYEGDGRYLPRGTTRFAWENSWKQPGDDALVPQQIWGGNPGSRLSNSSRWLFQGDYVRLRNVTLSYQVPEEWAGRVGLRNLRAHLNLNNYYTWVADDLLHFDPEQTISGVYNTITPISKTFTFGFTTGF
jgi:TonB-linked SusC/RagA family outer membrane protein